MREADGYHTIIVKLATKAHVHQGESRGNELDWTDEGYTIIPRSE